MVTCISCRVLVDPIYHQIETLTICIEIPDWDEVIEYSPPIEDLPF